MRRLYELSVLALGWLVIGVILVTPNVPTEQRAGALVAVAGAWLLLARMMERRRGP